MTDGSYNHTEAKKLKEEGNAFFKAKKYQEAVTKYQGAISVDPSCAVYYSNLCICYFRLKRYGDLESTATKCVAIDPDFVKGHYWLVMSLKHLKKYKEATSKSEEALKKFPNNDDIKLLHSEIRSEVQIESCGNPNCPLRDPFKAAQLGKISWGSSDDFFIIIVKGKPDDVSFFFFSPGLKVCSACEETYYCSKKCQKMDWKLHKLTCKGNEGGFFNCTNCSKRFSISKKVPCSTCGKEFYCSQNCADKDRANHSKYCISNSNEPKEVQLLNKWYDSPEGFGYTITELSTHVMTKEQFMNKKPDFVIETVLKFEENYLSFVPVELPKIVYLHEFPAAFGANIRSCFEQYAPTVKPLEYGHVMLVHMEGQRHCRVRHQVLSPADYRRRPLQEVMNSFYLLNSSTNPFVDERLWKKKWSPIFENQMASWRRKADEDGNFLLFVWGAFRLQSRKTRKKIKQHALVIDMELGKELGEIKRIISYSVKKRKDLPTDAMNNMAAEDQKTPPGHIVLPTLFVTKSEEITPRSHVCFTAICIPWDPKKIVTKSEKQIDADNESLWKKLLKVPFPECSPTPVSSFSSL